MYPLTLVMRRSIMKEIENFYLLFGANASKKQTGYFSESHLTANQFPLWGTGWGGGAQFVTSDLADVC